MDERTSHGWRTYEKINHAGVERINIGSALRPLKHFLEANLRQNSTNSSIEDHQKGKFVHRQEETRDRQVEVSTLGKGRRPDAWRRTEKAQG